MENKFDDLAGRLRCPDDRAELSFKATAATCTQCARVYPIQYGQLLELLPSRPVDLPPSHDPEYVAEYRRAFLQRFELREGSMSWGAPEISPPRWIKKRERQVEAVRAALAGTGEVPRDAVLCDISAGAGYYTFGLARNFPRVLHCDLSVASLAYAMRKAARLRIPNVLFLRLDYFRMPFAESLEHILCFDTLIHGECHEEMLLRQIRGALTPAGSALVDFHNWWHNPARRRGLLPQNFANNRSYSRAEAESLLCRCGIDRSTFRPFYREFNLTSPWRRALSRLIPPARLIFEFPGPSQPAARPAVDDSKCSVAS